MAKKGSAASGTSTAGGPGAVATSKASSAKAPSALAATGVPTPRAIPVPPANLASLVTRKTWPAGDTIHRIHLDVYAAEAFNPGPKGNARFSPISDASGTAIPTIYGGTTFECAAMETVFHDVPHAPGLKSVAKRKLRGHQHSQLVPSSDLTLADLSSKALRKLGIQRADLIDSEKDIYPQTRPWAEAVHDQCPDVHGMEWVSRQDDTARAIILFEDRLPPAPLQSKAPSADIVSDVGTYTAIVGLADTIGVKITGK